VRKVRKVRKVRTVRTVRKALMGEAIDTLVKIINGSIYAFNFHADK
jgi:hypothetical protein